jgi:hypothetical protein
MSALSKVACIVDKKDTNAPGKSGVDVPKEKPAKAIAFGKRLLNALQKKEFRNRAAFADAAGVHRSTVYSHLKGERFPDDDETIEKYARTLGMSVGELLGYVEPPTQSATSYKNADEIRNGPALLKVPSLIYKSLTVMATAAAGQWIEMSALGTAEVIKGVLPVLPGEELPEDATYALITAGSSADRAAPAGSWLVCVDIAKAGIEIADGDLVVVHQTRPSLGLIKISVHGIRKAGNGWDLHYESTDPQWSEVIHLDEMRQVDGDHVIEIVAKVVFTIARPRRA